MRSIFCLGLACVLAAAAPAVFAQDQAGQPANTSQNAASQDPNAAAQPGIDQQAQQQASAQTPQTAGDSATKSMTKRQKEMEDQDQTAQAQNPANPTAQGQSQPQPGAQPAEGGIDQPQQQTAAATNPMQGGDSSSGARMLLGAGQEVTVTGKLICLTCELAKMNNAGGQQQPQGQGQQQGGQPMSQGQGQQGGGEDRFVISVTNQPQAGGLTAPGGILHLVPSGKQGGQLSHGQFQPNQEVRVRGRMLTLAHAIVAEEITPVEQGAQQSGQQQNQNAQQLQEQIQKLQQQLQTLQQQPQGGQPGQAGQPAQGAQAGQSGQAGQAGQAPAEGAAPLQK